MIAAVTTLLPIMVTMAAIVIAIVTAVFFKGKTIIRGLKWMWKQLLKISSLFLSW